MSKTYALHVLVQGYPGRSLHHGGLGWSTVGLLRSRDGAENVLLDTGHYMHRDVLPQRLAELGLRADEITAIAVSHAHWDHCLNVTLFPKAQIFIGAAELEWAASQPAGKYPVAELHVEWMMKARNVERIADGDQILPGIEALATPGHTPGHMAYVAQGERGEYIYTGDAIKNGAELCSQRVEMTLEEERSLAAVRRVRERAAANPESTIVFGHDRCCGFDGAHLHEREPLRFELKARFTEDFEDLTFFDLGRPAVRA
ncbi:MAG: MBL fold metallo-hydrolase [Candidatus Eremiobacteraeota bacterium]|nr:MBL fold metallo-hydrolase [Candidatus Eremiobacteraeota bacterium]